jgi:hypothetical protein
MNRSNSHSVRDAIATNPIKVVIGAISFVALILAFSATVPELIRYVRMRRM